MPISAFNGQVQDQQGNVITVFQVEVRKEADNSLAAIYADRDGLTPLGNPFTPSPLANGYFRFHVAAGAYSIRAFTVAGDQATWRFEAIGILAESDTLTANQIVFTPAGNLLSIDVQNAIEELDGEKAALPVTNALLADMPAWSIKMHNAGTAGVPQDLRIDELTQDSDPTENGDLLLGADADQSLRKFSTRLVGGVHLLAVGAVSNAATLDIVLTSFTAYRAIRFVLTEIVPQNDTVEFMMRTSSDGGSSYDAGVSDYIWGETFYNASTDFESNANDIADSDISLSGVIGNRTGNAGESLNMDITLYDQASASGNKLIAGRAVKVDATSQLVLSQLSGGRVSGADVDAVRFLFSAGNIGSGKYAVYGLV